MDLLRTIKQLKVPLASEEKKKYTNQSVKGSYTAFALEKVSIALAQENNETIVCMLKELKSSLLAYQNQPNCKGLQAVAFQLEKLSEFLLQPVNQIACRALMQKPLQYLKGVGPKRVRAYEKLGVYSVEDLLSYFPKDYVDRSLIVPISMAINGERQSFMGKVISAIEHRKGRFSILKVIIWDRSGSIALVFFNQAYLKKIFENHINSQIIVSGKVSWQFHQWQMDNPEYEWIEEEDTLQPIHTARIVPIYRMTEGLFPKTFRSVMYHALKEYQESIYEIIPAQYLDELDLPLRKYAFWNMHFPESLEVREKARKRMAFEEFLMGQFSLLYQKELMKKDPAQAFTITENDLIAFQKLLPYKLSSSQQKVIEEIVNDLKLSIPMQRLIHGEVGSGKTTVAAAALYFSFLNHYQSAFMAPTEILARQCYENFLKTFSGLPLRIKLLISDIKEKDRTKIIHDLAQGEVDIIVGTHALIQRDVIFKSLGLAVVDEQHRFGVKQRLELRKKGTIPHLLVMSATPIPRTLALTQFGDLDVSLIDQMPMGKKSIQTRILENRQLPKLYEWVKEKLVQGGKMFVICPLVEDSEKMDLSSSIGSYEELVHQFEEFNVFLLHGRMNAKEKDEVMQQFSSAKGHILVSTTVVEVGIDVPEANIMVVEDADRFGLAQLHQLRGRIGRKSQKAYCFLIIKNTDNKQRLSIMEESDSGFVVAQKDLELRGPGELWGERQSGYYFQSVIQLEQDGPLLEQAKIIAQKILQNEKHRYVFLDELDYRKKKITRKDILSGD